MHLRVPLTLGSRPDGSSGFRTVLEDSPEEVDQCMFAILNTPVGHRTDLPEFGRPAQAFRRGGADLAALERALALWEPRIDLIGLRATGRLAEVARALEDGTDTVRIQER